MKRIVYGLVIAALALLPLRALTAQEAASGSRFDQWVQRYTDDTMRFNTDAAANRRYFVASDPRFQDSIEGQIQHRDVARRAQAHALARRGLAELKAFDPSKLNESQRVAASIIRWDLENQVEGARFEDVDYPFTQTEGAQSTLVSLLTVNHPMNTPRDAQNYVARVGLLASRMDESVTEARRLAAKQLLPPRFILQAVAQQIRTFVGMPAGKNPLVTTFADKAAQIKGLEGPQREQMQQRVEQIVSGAVYPAWTRALALIEEEIPASTTDAGLWRFPNGVDAYNFKLKRFTTTSLAAHQIHDLGLKLVADIEGRMDTILRSLGYTEGTVRARMEKMRADQPRFPDTAEGRAQYQAFNAEIIADAERRAAVLFERVPKMRVVAQPYPEFLGPRAQSYTVGTTDGSRPGTFQYAVVGVPLTRFGVRTIAYHEAIPGHHFQLALIAEDPSLPGFLKNRVFGGNSAITEGWGLYAEQVAAEQGWYEGDAVGLLGQLDADVFRARRLVVDTGLHAKRWTREQAIEYLGPNPAGSAVAEVERYIARPGQACSYMIGKLKILELRERATKQLGSRFSLSEFHARVLGAGPVPLDVLEAAIDRWIAAKKAA